MKRQIELLTFEIKKPMKRQIELVFIWSLLVGLIMLIFLAFACEQNIFRTYLETTKFLNLTPPNGTLVFFLAMTMACTDGLILLCLTMFNTIKASRSVHMLVLLNNVLAVMAACMPLSWEANTDSSIAMFALYDSTFAFWAYAFTLGLLLSVGSGWLVQNTRVSYVVAVQAACLVFSDVPMFIASLFGLPHWSFNIYLCIHFRCRLGRKT